MAIASLAAVVSNAHGDGVAQQWTTRHTRPVYGYSDGARALVVDGSGSVIVTGYSTTQNGSDYYTAKYGAGTGTLLWEKTYNGPSQYNTDEAKAVAVDGDGNVIVTGRSTSGSYDDYYTAKYAAADGALLWEQRYDGPAHRHDVPAALAVDGAGNVVVTGYSAGSGANTSDYYTVKYAAADGAVLWEKRYDGSGFGDAATAVALDGVGNVIVTGNSRPANKHDDYYTAKYAAADGALLWERRYNGPKNDYDYATAVAVDADGNVIVTGSSYANSETDFYTAKYAAADGALLWEKRYDGPAGLEDKAHAVAVDGSGNVIVTGESRSNGLPDYYTAKYAAADGALLWERRYDDVYHEADVAYAVVVDGNGDVIVSGAAWINHYDYYTVKYASADGATRWEKHYNKSQIDYVVDKSLALTPDGGVAVTGTSYDRNDDFLTIKYMPVETTTLAASAVGVTSATFNGSVSPGGVFTSVRYEWGTTPALGNVTNEVWIGDGTVSVPVPLATAGLPADATIYFRIRSDSSEGTNYGAVLSFTLSQFKGWKLTYLGDENAPDDGDPDGDGLETLAEYGLALFPMIPETAPEVTAFDYADGRRLRMVVQRDPSHYDVTVEVQAADFPEGPWTTVATSANGAPFTGPGYVSGEDGAPGLKTVEVRDVVRVGEAGQRFMRARVTH